MQEGLIYYQLPTNIAKPDNNTGLRLFRDLNDGNYYVKYSNGTVELFTVEITGLMEFRGGFDASANLFPATGGSGIGGAIQKGDTWVITVGGTLNGQVVTAGDLIIALVDNPAQVGANWTAVENNIGYVPENVANKATDFSVINNILYPTVQAVENRIALIPPSGVVALFQETVDSGSVGGGNQPIYVNNVPANTLVNIGDRIKLKYAVRTLASALTAKLFQISFNAVVTYNSFATGNIAFYPFLTDFEVDVTIIRISGDTIKVITGVVGSNVGTFFDAQYNFVGALDFTVLNTISLRADVAGGGEPNGSVTGILAEAIYVPKA